MAGLKIAVLISGRGSNLQSLIEATKEKDFPAEIVAVISNVPGARGLERAKNAGLPVRVVDHKNFSGRETFEDAINDVLDSTGAELICMAGFMRLVSDGFVQRWHDRLVNIHPSLLPAFKGLRVHERAIEAGVRFSGCTVHFVRSDMDCGPVIVQAAVPVRAGDDAGALAARVLEQEHKAYPLAVRLIAEGRVRVENERAIIEGANAPGGVLLNPEPILNTKI
jgi:phosphoribosylglycinamide formyltransferase-1